MKVFFSIALFALATSLVPLSLCAQQKDTSSGERIFSSSCAACHGADGRGGERAPDIATRRSVVSLADTDLETIVKKGIPSAGMPPFGYMGDQKVNDVVAFLRVLQGKVTVKNVKGDPQAGHALFYGKAGCSKCHMMHGEGGFIAADLSTYGNGTPAAAVHDAIVAPDKNLSPASKVVDVRTLSGRRISGLLRSEDNFNIALQTEDGRYHMYSKAKLASIQHTDRSIMPTDYESRLSSKELEDLVSFLITTASPSQPGEHSPKRKHND